VLAELILPQSYIQRQAVSKKAGIFTFVTWSDIAERSIEFDEFRAQLASLHTENLIALICMISIIQTSHIYPVLVLLHPYPQNMATWQPLQGHIPTPELIQCGSEFLTAEVHHAQILTAEELEMLEPLLHAGQYSLPNLLKTKTGDEFWMVQSMKNFLLRSLKIEEQSNEYLLTRYNEITARMRQVIADEVDLPHE
jgi:hypothetical protein